ncbi:MAG: MerR family transcriptional regulator, partial [Bacillota bacterium]
MMAETLLDIDQVNQLTGLPQATLRNWEKRYGFPRPQRSQGGHRLYGLGEIQNLRAVVELYKSGIKVRDAIEQVLTGATPKKPKSEIAEGAVLPLILNDGLREVIEALYRYDEDGAAEHLSRIGMRLNETDLLEMVYPQILTSIG